MHFIYTHSILDKFQTWKIFLKTWKELADELVMLTDSFLSLKNQLVYKILFYMTLKEKITWIVVQKFEVNFNIYPVAVKKSASLCLYCAGLHSKGHKAKSYANFRYLCSYAKGAYTLHLVVEGQSRRFYQGKGMFVTVTLWLHQCGKVG